MCDNVQRLRYNLPERVEEDIKKIAVRHQIKKIILFGSRARGTNKERSDIDLAVMGGNVTEFYYDIEEEVHTLLMFDVVNLNNSISDELQSEIDRDGVLIYEEV